VSRERVAIRPRADSPDARREILERARRRGFRRFVVPAEDDPGHGPGEWTAREDSEGFRPPEPGAAPVVVTSVDAEEDLRAFLDAVRPGATVAIEWTGDRVIPLENAVAARGNRFTLWTVARTPTEVPGALGALEHGADLVIVDVGSVEDLEVLESVVEGPLPTALAWVLAPLVDARPAGVGDRVIVDTTSLLGATEGLLVGSAAALLAHVASEATGSRFSRPRPFRVNAGAAHSYVLLADGSTRYLAELGAGDAVLVVAPGGRARSARVGRIKIERRPLVQVSMADGDATRTLFLQEAESVRLSTEGGPVATTELRPGARVHAVRLPPARHLGRAVEEAIEER
jgi:3-dehydroquinate synthase II